MNYGRLASLLCGLSLATSSSLSAQSADAPPVPSRADVAGAVVRTVATELLDSIPYRRIALAISGGISKGSYQAGVAFGIVRVARDLESAALRRDGYTTFPTIVASTGASAGNIIAVLLAVDYCRAELGLAEESSLARAWLPVGRERLLVPRESNKGLRKRMAPSSVLSQEYLRDSIGLLLITGSKHARAKSDCRIPTGIALTRRAPEVLGGSGDVRVLNSRFSVVMTIGSSLMDTTIRFQPFLYETDAENRHAGATIDLASACDAEITSRDIVSAVLASAAFPIAFPPVRIAYRNRSASGQLHCDKPSDSGVFLDGGVFDNNPVDLLAALTELSLKAEEARARSAQRYSDSLNAAKHIASVTE